MTRLKLLLLTLLFSLSGPAMGEYSDFVRSSLAARTTPPIPRGRAPEIPSGQISESGVMRQAENYLGSGYKEVPPGRYVSADGTRQFRYGAHETRNPANHHAHFESLEGGRVTENAVVKIVPDP